MEEITQEMVQQVFNWERHFCRKNFPFYSSSMEDDYDDYGDRREYMKEVEKCELLDSEEQYSLCSKFPESQEEEK